MKIRSIEIEGLWSYREKQHIDIAGLPLIVGVGENGSGKSALLVHAIGFALYGKFPTKTAEASISEDCASGSVSIEFDLGGTVYRVGRVQPRTGSASGVVEVIDETSKSGWRPLTGNGAREVTAYVTELLGMDYETATMTWIAEQGQYGKFAGAQPIERFHLLSNVFGLNVYADKVKLAQKKAAAAAERVTSIEGRYAEVEHSLDTSDSAAPEAFVDTTDEELGSQLSAANGRLDRLNSEFADLAVGDPARRVSEAKAALDVVRNARLHNLETAQESVTRAENERTAAERRHREAVLHADNRRDTAIAQSEERTRQAREAATRQKDQAASALEQIKAAEGSLPGSEQKLATAKQQAKDARAQAQEQVAESVKASNERTRLLTQFKTHKQAVLDADERIKTLEHSIAASESECFACGQHLSEKEAQILIAALRTEISTAEQEQARIKVAGEQAKARTVTADSESARLNAEADRFDRIASAAQDEITRAKTLIAEKSDRQKALREADDTLMTVDTTFRDEMIQHDNVRKDEVVELDKVLARETTNAQAAADEANALVRTLQTPTTHEDDLAAALATVQAAAQAEINQLNEQRTQLEQKRTTVRNEIQTITAERARRTGLIAKRAELEARLELLSKDRDAAALDHQVHQTIVKAFSPGGIPAMVLGSMMDDLNAHINEVLSKLSRGQLQVRLTAAKDDAKNLNDNKVTVYVETPEGTRTYEAISGGMKFRVDLAIRTGLANAVSRGTGTPIQTFVLDESWGTLDEKGILDTVQTLFRLSESTNVVTVSHIDQVRDAFPARVEVEKIGGNSVATIAGP